MPFTSESLPANLSHKLTVMSILTTCYAVNPNELLPVLWLGSECCYHSNHVSHGVFQYKFLSGDFRELNALSDLHHLLRVTMLKPWWASVLPLVPTWGGYSWQTVILTWQSSKKKKKSHLAANRNSFFLFRGRPQSRGGKLASLSAGLFPRLTSSSSHRALLLLGSRSLTLNAALSSFQWIDRISFLLNSLICSVCVTRCIKWPCVVKCRQHAVGSGLVMEQFPEEQRPDILQVGEKGWDISLMHSLELKRELSMYQHQY